MRRRAGAAGEVGGWAASLGLLFSVGGGMACGRWSRWWTYPAPPLDGGDEPARAVSVRTAAARRLGWVGVALLLPRVAGVGG